MTDKFTPKAGESIYAASHPFRVELYGVGSRPYTHSLVHTETGELIGPLTTKQADDMTMLLQTYSLAIQRGDYLYIEDLDLGQAND